MSAETTQQTAIAYFSMEIGLDPAMPTYNGGLGVLAGDTIRSAADLKIPLVAITLLYSKGYFYQKLDPSGYQIEEPVEWIVDDFLEDTQHRISIVLEGRTVHIQAWKYQVSGTGGFIIPVYFLDTDLPENSEWDRKLTDYLYGGDKYYRLCQEIILGMGGIKILRDFGYENIRRFHMNEGHSSLLTLELLNEEVKKANRSKITIEEIESVRDRCVFTTHTPVPSGHDQFPLDLVNRVLETQEVFTNMKDIFFRDGVLNMTHLALQMSRYVNGVAKKHGEVSRLMFAGYSIDAITNGVHASTWVSEPFQELYDKYIPGWREDNFSLRYALNIPNNELWHAHIQSKKYLINYVNYENNIGMDKDVLTIGFARRATTYKRGDLLFQDIERLKKIASQVGEFQVIYAGKAHPQDHDGKELIKRIFRIKESLKHIIKIVYLSNYSMEIGKMMTSGVDIWLNTPQPPLEASGTSGMKTALNGVPSLSVLDGWWIEGHIEGITGWSIGEIGKGIDNADDWNKDASSLYDKLEQTIIPLFYQDREQFINIMCHCIALNGSFFNTQRMMLEYVSRAYF